MFFLVRFTEGLASDLVAACSSGEAGWNSRTESMPVSADLSSFFFEDDGAVSLAALRAASSVLTGETSLSEIFFSEFLVLPITCGADTVLSVAPFGGASCG